MADLVIKYKVSPNPKGWDEQGQFLAGNVAMRTCGRWCIAGLLQNKFTDYDLVYQPHKSGSILTDAGTDGWGVCSKSKTPNEAFTVAAALSGPEISLAMTKLGGNIPALKSVAAMPEFAQYGPKNTAIFLSNPWWTAISPPSGTVKFRLPTASPKPTLYSRLRWIKSRASKLTGSNLISSIFWGTIVPQKIDFF
jgi:ABC-type glycerol-3-phosphate transport system substrate-binding protein